MALALLLLALFISGCKQQPVDSKVNVVTGTVSVVDEGAGLGDVTMLLVGDVGSDTETDASGYFEFAALPETIVLPRKTGYKFSPSELVVGENKKLEFLAYPWEEPDFTNWGIQFSFSSHSDLIEAVAISPDDQYLASGSADRTIRIWRIEDAQLVRTLKGSASGITAR